MEFEVKPNRLNGIASNERGIRDSLNSLNGDLESCRNNLSGCLSSSASYSISKSINNVRNRLGITASKIGVMGDKLDTIAKMYSHTESAILGHTVSAEKVSKAKNYNMDGDVKTNDSYIELILKIFGIDEPVDENVSNIAALISKISKKINDKSVLTVIGPSMAYGNNLWEFLYKSVTGQMDAGVIFNLTQNGSGVWQSMYKYLDKHLVSELNKSMPHEFAMDTVLGNEFGNAIGYAALIGSSVGFLKKYGDALNGNYNSWQEMIGEWFGVGAKGVGVAEAAYNLSHMSNGVVSGVEKGKGGWFILGETILNVCGEAFSSYGKYNQDGKITVEEGAEIAMESSVKGLTTIISGVTFGIVDIDSDAVSVALEDWGEKKGAAIGRTIAQNPTMKDKYLNGNIVEQVGVFGWGIVKNQLDEDVENVKKAYNVTKKVGVDIAEKIINK